MVSTRDGSGQEESCGGSEMWFDLGYVAVHWV
jgi:hypothetical protein